MVILSARQIHDWDQFTIQNEPISSLDLMEAASIRCFQWLQQNNYLQGHFKICCGKGNNGGDGLAIARLLSRQGISVSVFILELGQKGTADFQANLARLHQTGTDIHYVQTPEHFPLFSPGDIVVDALFGTGLNRKLEGLPAALVTHINTFTGTVISIDMPSGLLADDSSSGFAVVAAGHTISFQCLKLAFMMPENEQVTGQVHVLNIGLHRNYLSTVSYEAILLEEDFVKTLYRPRKRFSHKGNFGHAALVCGSFGYMGAATLAANACLRSGVGKLTCHIPACGYVIMQVAVPEAMSLVEPGENYITSITGAEKYTTLGIGPGMGLQHSHTQLLANLFSVSRKSMVIDADALTLLSRAPELIKNIPPFSIITPHPAEFDRLFGVAADDFARMRMAQLKARELQVVIVLKGHRSFIAMPGGKGFFNSTGNPGMAKGGSGDVLTGMLTALMAQGYTPQDAALFGVYLHGLAGDQAAAILTEEAMTASDITAYLGAAFSRLRQ
jgi:NAD(P)H-hydrate epimerase